MSRRAYDAQEVLRKIADVASAVAQQAGVGGMETAGSIVSYLASHPDDLEPFMNGGWFELPDMHHRVGCLSWQGSDGKVWTPEDARLAAVVHSMRPKA